jgi:glycosidase
VLWEIKVHLMCIEYIICNFVRVTILQNDFMKRIICLSVFSFLMTVCYAQLLSWTPDFATDVDNITITVDASKGNQGLMGFNGNVYAHVGVITNLSSGPSGWKYVKFAWGSNEAGALATPDGPNKWKYSITNMRTFFNVPGGEQIQKIAVLFRSGGCVNDCKVQRNTDGSDMYIPVYDNMLSVRFNVPFMQPKFIPVAEPINKNVGDNINATAVSNKVSTMKIYFNGTVVQTAAGVTSISANPTITAAGNQQLVAEAFDGSTTKYDTVSFFVSTATNIAPLPAGVRDGINYEPGNTAVTLVLNAPSKNRVSVLGEFPGSNWTDQTQYQMNKTPDGNYWWIRINGLTPGTAYAFQYLVDGILKIADPYAEMILDPFNDQFISATTFPNLKAYPAGQTGIVCVLQTASPAYSWSVANFNRPDKRNLMIYELNLQDFIAAHDWKTLKDTLNYFKTLGINALEIMPFNEFGGNIGWGYNPDFYFAPDKYYGPRNTLKEFIDSCHKNGIAVIMDIALNHATGQNPMAALYWDAVNNQPAANNPWFNPIAKHPFNVFNDFNHESPNTKYFFNRVTEHWLKEYKIDGFRFDLSKGFTQVNTGSDVSAWSNYDASRVAIWKRYYDSLQVYSPDSYVILEHFATNSEEKELSDYGMLLWGNMNYNFSEASMGIIANSNFVGGLSTNRGWTNPYLITYMESHDEERMMFRNLQFGSSSGPYNIKDLNTALKRIELSAAFLYAMPGPKMLWQFGELGYDFSINRCTDGTINNNCRLDPKPIRWDYLQNAQRKQLYDVHSKLLKLRAHPLYKAAFMSNRVTSSLSGTFKWIQVTTDTSNLCVIGNFGVNAISDNVSFQNAGTWYDYLSGTMINATGTSQSFTLQPGEYRVYVNRNINNVVPTSVRNIPDPGTKLIVGIFPNPVINKAVLEIETPESGKVDVSLWSTDGKKLMNVYSGFLQKGSHQINLFSKNENEGLSAGTYILNVNSKTYFRTVKVLIK